MSNTEVVELVPTLFGGWVPSAVALDCDGTLVDSERCVSVAQAELFARRGLRCGAAYELAVFGTSLDARSHVLASLFDEPGQAAAISAELLALTIEAIECTTAGALPMPGACELVAAMGALVPVALVSNSPRAMVDASLRRAGLTGAFDVVVAAEAVTEPKPAPDPYLLACIELGTYPADTLAVEDSAVGVCSATSAGLPTIAVPSRPGHGRDADAVVASLLDPALTNWVGGWARVPARMPARTPARVPAKNL